MTGARRAWGRGVSVCVALFVCTCVAASASAWATPTATLKVTPVPIPGFAGTGDILGAGAEAEVEMTIHGTEYGGSPSPLVGLTFYAPKGVRVIPTGFGTCTLAVLEADGPEGCSKRSNAGPTGEGLGVVSFGDTRVDEKVSINELFAPGGGLTFYVEGTTPSVFQIPEHAHWVAAGGQYGPELLVEVPLVETVPDGYDASILSFKVAVGAAHRQGKKVISYFMLPKTCPKGGAPLKAELKFMSGEVVTVTEKQPCPRRG